MAWESHRPNLRLRLKNGSVAPKQRAAAHRDEDVESGFGARRCCWQLSTWAANRPSPGGPCSTIWSRRPAFLIGRRGAGTEKAIAAVWDGVPVTALHRSDASQSARARAGAPA